MAFKNTMIRSTGIKRCIAVLTAIFLYVVLFYHQSSPSSVNKLSPMEEEKIKRIMEVVKMNTTAVVLPDEVTTLIEPSISHQCLQNGGKQYLLLMFISSPENFQTRNTIRSVLNSYMHKWDSYIVEKHPEFYHNESIRALFFLGMPTNGAIDVLSLTNEAETYQDVIIDDFRESYLNLTVKTLRMLKWVQHNCPDVRYMVKVDDDVFLNVPALLKLLNKFDSDNSGQNLIAGHVYNEIDIDGNPNSKWFTPKFLWRKKFPNFVAGFCYILGTHARISLYENALHTPLFHLEDVFLTGIVRHNNLHIDVVNLPVFVSWSFSQSLYPACKVGAEVAIIHGFAAEKSKCYMQYTDPAITCILPYYFPMVVFC